jgi:hypothetical protein
MIERLGRMIPEREEFNVLRRSGECSGKLMQKYFLCVCRIQTQRLYNEECKFREGIAVRTII